MAASHKAFVLFVPFDIGARRVEEEEVDIEVQQIGDGEEDLCMDKVTTCKKDIHGPVEVLEGNRFEVAQGDIASDPLLHRPFGGRGKGPVGHHGEECPVNGTLEGAVFEGPAEELRDTQLLPEPPQQMCPTHGGAPDEG